ncbi:MAG: hypothetical protein QXF57_01650, partial [Acidilobaceae archaeon]
VTISLLSELMRLVKLVGDIAGKSSCAVRGKGSCISVGAEKLCSTGCYNYRVAERPGEFTVFRSTDRPLVIALKENSIRVATRAYALELEGSRVKLVAYSESRKVEVDLAMRDSLLENLHLFKTILPELARELEITSSNLSTCLRMSAIACT